MAGTRVRKQHGGRGSELPVKEELNLVEFPFALLADSVPEGLKTLEFADTIEDRGRGETVRRRVIVTAADHFGLPNWQDQDILLALMTLTFRRNGFRDRKVAFSLYELRELLGYPHNGSYNQRLQLALDRWCGVTVKFENAWRKGDCWTSETFHFLDNVKLSRGRDLTPEEEQVFKWNDVVVSSIQANHTKPFDWEFYRELKNPTAKRLYRFLDKRFALRPRWDYEVVQFGTEKLGLLRGQPTFRYKERLKPAVAELESSGFLQRLGSRERFTREGKGRFRVWFEKGVGVGISQAPSGRAAAASAVEQALLERGVTNARELVSKYPEAKIREQIENYDDRRAAREDIGPGWLGASITHETGYGFRKGFVSAAERAARQAAAVASKQRELAAAEQQRERSRVEHEQQVARVEEYLASLPSDEVREAFEAEAARADPFLHARYAKAKREGGKKYQDYRFVVLKRAVDKVGSVS